ncbi:MAG: response regulator [Sphingomonas sp.]
MAIERRIHIVDDDDAARDSLTILLQTLDFDVTSWASAIAYAESCIDGAAHCVLCDVRMPELTGFDLVRRIRARGVATPVILLTGHYDSAVAEQAREAGAFTVLEKPFSLDALMRAMDAVPAAG